MVGISIIELFKSFFSDLVLKVYSKVPEFNPRRYGWCNWNWYLSDEHELMKVTGEMVRVLRGLKCKELITSYDIEFSHITHPWGGEYYQAVLYPWGTPLHECPAFIKVYINPNDLFRYAAFDGLGHSIKTPFISCISRFVDKSYILITEKKGEV